MLNWHQSLWSIPKKWCEKYEIVFKEAVPVSFDVCEGEKISAEIKYVNNNLCDSDKEGAKNQESQTKSITERPQLAYGICRKYTKKESNCV